METTEHVGYAGAKEITGINIGTLYSLVNQKKIPHIRIGKRHVLFSIKELREWLERHRVVSIKKAEIKGARNG
jgi:excisionase family DNA binding protein